MFLPNLARKLTFTSCRPTASRLTMVVFHSPVQRRRRTPGFSTSPAPPGPLDEDPDNIFNATPGPARSRSVDAASAAGPSGSSHVKPDAAGKSTDGKSAPGSAVLQQRLQQSLMMVAESPSSKLNAPDPFRPRKQLRRSPPVAMKAFDHPPRAQNKQSGIAITSIDEQEERAVDVPVASVSAGSPPAPSAKGKEKARSFDVAAKALFDSDRHDKGMSSVVILNCIFANLYIQLLHIHAADSLSQLHFNPPSSLPLNPLPRVTADYSHLCKKKMFIVLHPCDHRLPIHQ